MKVYDHDLTPNPLVSVIIPSYNRLETICQTLDSVLSQVCDFDYEIVIGDDASSDNIKNILINYKNKYPDQINLFFNEINVGLGANWAMCVLKCKGKYIANCDNDDYWHNPNKLQIQVDFLEKNKDIGVCHTDYRLHNRITGEIIEVVVSNIEYKSEELQNIIFNGKFKCCNATIMYRKELLFKYLSLEDYINLKFTLQDWNTWIILAKYTKFYCLPISTSTFGVETESITRPLNFEKLEMRLLKEKECYKYICKLFPDTFLYKENEYEEYINLILLNFAFEKKIFSKAKKHGRLVKSNKIKKLFSTNKLFFIIFCLMKEIKHYVFDSNPFI